MVAKIFAGFEARVLAFDPRVNEAVTAVGGRYLPLETLLAEAEIVTLHCPLTPETRHLIRRDRLAAMRDGALLVNTGRGALIDAPAVVDALKTGKLGGVALDVYEEEDSLFGRDHSGEIIADDVFARLLTFPNVVITGHQAYFTEPALRATNRPPSARVCGAIPGQAGGRSRASPRRTPRPRRTAGRGRRCARPWMDSSGRPASGAIANTARCCRCRGGCSATRAPATSSGSRSRRATRDDRARQGGEPMIGARMMLQRSVVAEQRDRVSAEVGELDRRRAGRIAAASPIRW